MCLPKIRAWDKESKFMTYSDVEYFDDSVNYRFKHFTVSSDYKVVFMQSTGLRDKNSIEIFVGDVVRSVPRSMNASEEIVGIVSYCEKNAMFYLDNDESNRALSENYLATNHYNFEILGNIYEKPQMLKITYKENKVI